MQNVIIGRVTGVRFEEGMANPTTTVKSSDGHVYTYPLTSKGAWQFLRLEYSRKIDAEIKEFKATGEKPIFEFAVQKVAESPPKKEWQILVKNGKIITFASQKHVLMTEEEIYTTVQKRLKKLKLVDRSPIPGKVIYIKDVAGLKLGVNVYAGDIYTQHAIKFATFIEVKECFNPLTFLKLKAFIVRTKSARVERLLRIYKTEDLENRLYEVLKNSLTTIDTCMEVVEGSKKTKITDEQATKLLVAMNTSFLIGSRVTENCLEQYTIEKRKHGKNLWALAMATSWLAQHGQCFLKHHTKTRAALSTISGALLLVDDLPNSIKGCEEYIKENGEAKKLYEDILKWGKDNEN